MYIFDVAIVLIAIAIRLRKRIFPTTYTHENKSYVLHTTDYCITFSLTSIYFSSKIVSFRTSGLDKDS